MNDSFKDTIQPKSDQLNADDLITGAATYTITKVTRGSAEQPINIFLQEHPQPWKPCKSMRRVLIAIWGDKGTDWIGKRLTLFNDPSVKYGGVEVGGIRISHMEAIDAAKELVLTETRGKRKPYRIQPLIDLPLYPQDRFDANLPKWKEAIVAKTLEIEQILQGCGQIGKLTADQIETIKGLGLNG
jgi:hypothetical protein